MDLIILLSLATIAMRRDCYLLIIRYVMDDEDSSDVCVVWECLVREDVKKVVT